MSPSSVAYVLDKDGTLVHQGTPVDGAAAFLRGLHAPYVLLSNTGVQTAAEVAASLSETLGVAVPADRVLTARDAMERALRERNGGDSVVVVRDGHTATTPLASASGVVTCVAVFSDGKVEDFCQTVATVAHLVSRGAELWMTSVDSTVRERGEGEGEVRSRPGPGVFCDAVATVLGGRRRLPGMRVFGKGGTEDARLGETVMAMLRAQGYEGPRRQVTMVGDRWDTDVRMGARNGWRTCFVESGCHSLEDAPLLDAADVVAANVSHLLEEEKDETTSTMRGEGGDSRGRVEHWREEVWTTVREALRDAVRTVAREVARSEVTQDVSRWIAVKVSKLLTTPPRRVQSAPELAKMMGTYMAYRCKKPARVRMRDRLRRQAFKTAKKQQQQPQLSLALSSSSVEEEEVPRLLSSEAFRGTALGSLASKRTRKDLPTATKTTDNTAKQQHRQEPSLAAAAFTSVVEEEEEEEKNKEDVPRLLSSEAFFQGSALGSLASKRTRDPPPHPPTATVLLDGEDQTKATRKSECAVPPTTGGCVAVALWRLGVFSSEAEAIAALDRERTLYAAKVRADYRVPDYLGFAGSTWHPKVIQQTVRKAGFDYRLVQRLNDEDCFLVDGVANDRYLRHKTWETPYSSSVPDPELNNPRLNPKSWQHAIPVKRGKIYRRYLPPLSAKWLWLDEATGRPDPTKGFLRRIDKIYKICPSR